MALECGIVVIGLVTGFVVVAFYVMALECDSVALECDSVALECGFEQWIGGFVACWFGFAVYIVRGSCTLGQIAALIALHNVSMTITKNY